MPGPTDLVDLGHGRGEARADAAASIRRLDERLGRPVDINSAYRDYTEQMKAYLAYRRYQNGTGPWAPLALHPDESWHCQGVAVDSDDGPNYGGPLTRAVWREFGWLFEVATESWHGQYYPNLDQHYGQWAGNGSVPFEPPQPKPRLQEVDMLVIESTGMLKGAPGWQFVLAPGYIKNVPDPEGLRYAAQTAQAVQPCDDEWLMQALWTHGLGEVFPSGSADELQTFLVSLSGGKAYVSPRFGGDGKVA